jgi:hypothetical protein
LELINEFARAGENKCLPPRDGAIAKQLGYALREDNSFAKPGREHNLTSSRFSERCHKPFNGIVLIVAQCSAMDGIFRTLPCELEKHRRFEHADVDAECLPAPNRLMSRRTRLPTGRYIDAIGLIEARCLAHLVHRARRWIPACGEFALDDPKLAVLDAKHVRSVVAGSSDKTHILKSIADE